MKKPRKQSRSRQIKPRTKAKKAELPALKERLDAEFAKAVQIARAYVGNPSRLSALFNDAAKEAESMPREPFLETWPYFQAMLRLIRAYATGAYRDIPESTLVVVVAAVVYIVNPLDVIPDAVPTLGYLDDATVLALAVRRSRQALDDFMAWETNTMR